MRLIGRPFKKTLPGHNQINNFGTIYKANIMKGAFLYKSDNRGRMGMERNG